jgi:hypothetical protein
METADELFHEPGDENHWSESHYLDFVGEDVTGHARIGFYPNRGTANVWAFLLDGEAVYWVAEESIPLAKVHGLQVREDDWTYGMFPDEPGEQWTVEWSGTVTRSTAPEDVLAGRGEPAEVDVEFTTTAKHDPFYYSDGATWPQEDPHDRYEVASRVEGAAVLDGEHREFAGHGERDHSWGPRQWAGRAEWLWISGGFEDGTAYNHNTVWLHEHPDESFINGFWYDGEEARAFTDATVHAAPEFGQETARDWSEGEEPTFEIEFEWDGGGTTVTVEPFQTTPLWFANQEGTQRALFNRSSSRQEKADGTVGAGWLENPTQFDLE